MGDARCALLGEASHGTHGYRAMVRADSLSWNAGRELGGHSCTARARATRSSSSAGRWAYGNYVPAVLPRRDDAFSDHEQTQALRPPWAGVPLEEVPETCQSGV